MHAKCIHVFDGADHDAVVVGVAHQLKLVFLPTKDGFLNQNVGFGGGCEATTCDAFEIFIRKGKA